MLQKTKRRMLRGSLVFAAGLLSVLTFSAEAFAEDQGSGWYTEGTKRQYAYEDGTLAVGTVIIDDVPYLFAPNGAQQVGWQTVNDRRYYYDPETGEPVFGRFQWRGEWYYVTPEDGKLTAAADTDTGRIVADHQGVLQTGWLQQADGWYYVDENGIAAASETVIDGCIYLFAPDGRLQTGWQTAADGITRYYDAETRDILTGWLTIEGSKYYADTANGRLTGWQQIDGAGYYLGTSGEMQIGWQEISGAKYYFGTTGEMQTGLVQFQGNYYFFADNGQQQTGFRTIDGIIYCFGENGAALRGLQTIGGDTYFFDSDCIACTGAFKFGTLKLFFDASGKNIAGWHTEKSGKYYIDPATGSKLTGWQTVDGKQYYFAASGFMAVGTVIIDGKTYRFRDDGSYVPVRICLDAGHYAKYNHSPVNSAYWESDFTWKMHLYLKAELERYGIEVITTRPNQETDLALEDRGRTSAGCDLFLSIHSNASTSPADDGPLACCAINGSADELGLLLANKIADVMGTNQRGSIWKREGLQGDWYGVLRGATKVGTPAILLEHSYHTNLRATNWLLVDANIQRMAAAEAELLARYFGVI